MKSKDKEIECLEWEINRRRNLEPLRFFVPNGAQEQFLKNVGELGIRTVIFSAGNGVGKTTAAICALAACIWPEMAEAKVFDTEIYRDWTKRGYVRRARIISTAKELEDIGSIQTEIKKWFPKGRYTAEKCGKIYNSKFNTDNGWIIDLMSFDQDKEQFEGQTISFFLFNEPPPENIYTACASRMRYGGKVLFAMTPLFEGAWILDKLIEKKDIHTRVTYGDIEQNCKKCGINGILEHDNIQTMIAQYDPDEREARVHGKFMHLAGRIYKGFDDKVHVIPQITSFPNDVQYWQVIDPAIGKPFAVVWAYVDATGTLTIYDEDPDFDFEGAKDLNITVKGYAELFRRKEAGKPVDNRILDRHFGNTRRNPGALTLRQELMEHNIDCMDSYNLADEGTEIETGILKVKSYLKYDKTKPIDSVNRPKLQITENCVNTIKSISRWARNPKTGKTEERYKDFCDCVRYLCMAEPTIEIRRPWRTRSAYYGVNTR